MNTKDLIYVIPKRDATSGKDSWRGTLPPFVKPIYVALKQNGKYRVFVEEKDLEKYPYIIPMSEDQFKERYEELEESLQASLQDDSGEYIHYLQHQSRSFLLTATLENSMNEDGKSILSSGTELQASECRVVEGEVVGLQWVNWAPGSQQGRRQPRQEIVRVFVLHNRYSLLIIDLIGEKNKNEPLVRGEAHQFEKIEDITSFQTVPGFLNKKLNLFHKSEDAFRLKPGMISSFGALCNKNFDSSIWKRKSSEDKEDELEDNLEPTRAVLCLEFDMALVTEKDEAFIESALTNTGIISSLVAGVAISTHFSPPGFQLSRASENSLIVNTDILLINSAILTGFITLNSIALFSALASLVLTIVPQGFHGTQKEVSALDGTSNHNLPHSMQKDYAANAIPMALYKSKCRALKYSLLLLCLSIFSLSAAIFLSGFLALFDNTWTMAFFIASFAVVFIVLVYMIFAVINESHKSSVNTWAKKHRKAPRRCRQSLHELAKRDDAEQIRRIFENAEDLSVDIDQVDGYGSTPLHVAAGNGCLDALHALIDLGASLQARDDTGRTPLYHAARWDHYKCISALLSKGADSNAKNDQDSTTALSRACDAGYVASVKVLLQDPRTEPSQRDAHGSTCLHWAVYGELCTNFNKPNSNSAECYRLVTADWRSSRDSLLEIRGAGGFKADELRQDNNLRAWVDNY